MEELEKVLRLLWLPEMQKKCFIMINSVLSIMPFLQCSIFQCAQRTQLLVSFTTELALMQ